MALLLRKNLDREFRAFLKRTGIDRKGLCIHSLRYTASSTLLAAGVPETVIRARMGHVTSKRPSAISIHWRTTGRGQERLLLCSESRTDRPKLQRRRHDPSPWVD